jgi:hypothetical protein
MKRPAKPLKPSLTNLSLGVPTNPPQETDPKFAKVLSAISDGDWDTAIKLAASVTKYGTHAEAIQRGKDAILNPDFYRQLGRDPDKLRSEAIAALKERLLPPVGNQKSKG